MDALIEFDEGRGRIWNQGAPRGHPLPLEVAARLVPARFALYEWTDYWVRFDGADRLRVGDTLLSPIEAGLFRMRFENQLGLASIQPFDARGSLCSPFYVEVLSPKFPTLQAHLSFVGTVIDDLFARAASLPFTFAAPTARAVVESPRPPTPLFAFYFLMQHAAELRSAWSVVQAKPHRRLTDHPALVPLGEAAEVDADVLLDVLRRPDRWVLASGFPLAKRLGGYAPAELWQRRPYESLDTPENRFVLTFLKAALAAAERLPAEPWWPKISPDRRHLIHEASALLRLAVAHPMFAEVGPMHRIPTASRVLMHREGYRQLRELWRRFHQARRPLFAELQHALDVRDVATLYETWVFFALVDEIGRMLGVPPTVGLTVSDESGLAWDATARFGAGRELVYNHSPRSYSVPLRPDFLWRVDGRATVALDAKFRLERREFAEEPDEGWRTTAKRADLYKMHAYRDALGVRAAVAVYPGDEVVFFDASQSEGAGATLSDILLEHVSGIGAVPMVPEGAR